MSKVITPAEFWNFCKNYPLLALLYMTLGAIITLCVREMIKQL